jgi:hypothetical protein
MQTHVILVELVAFCMTSAWFRVQGSGFRVWGLGFEVSCSGLELLRRGVWSLATGGRHPHGSHRKRGWLYRTDCIASSLVGARTRAEGTLPRHPSTWLRPPSLETKESRGSAKARVLPDPVRDIPTRSCPAERGGQHSLWMVFRVQGVGFSRWNRSFPAYLTGCING